MATVLVAGFENRGEFRVWLRAGPHGEDHGEARVAQPFFAEVENVQTRCRRIDAEGGVADDESGVGRAEHGGQVGNHRLQFGFQVVDLFEENPGEHDRGSRGAVEREAANLPNGFFAEEQDAADGSATGDAEVGDGFEVLALGFNDGDEAGVGVLALQLIGAESGKVEAEFGLPGLGTVEETPDEGAGVEVTDSAQARPCRKCHYF